MTATAHRVIDAAVSMVERHNAGQVVQHPFSLEWALWILRWTREAA